MICLSCFEPVQGTAAPYHAACLERWLGTRNVPVVEVSLANFHRMAGLMVGRHSLSGVQRKLAMSMSEDGKRLEVSARVSSHILKPQLERLGHLPEIEALTMRIAEKAGLEVAPAGLLALPDGTLAYLVRRFDRRPDGTKLQVEDFCQLSLRPPKDKYRSSSERCAAVIKRFASEPRIQLHRYFRLAVFSWWVGNEDLHLKNLALLTEPTGLIRLSPAYDLLASRLYFNEFDVALPVNGKQTQLRRKDWLEFAGRCDLPPRAAERALTEIGGLLDPACETIRRISLPEELEREWIALLSARTETLAWRS